MKHFQTFFAALLWISLTIVHQPLLAQEWFLSGNAGTNPTLHFIGTTDNQPLQFRVNNQRAGKLDPAGFNTIFGIQANGASNTGVSLSAFGCYALSSNTSGNGNSAFGRNALRSNTAGGDNTAVGADAMYYNTIGVWNTALGHGAMQNNSTGSSNTAVGDLAMYLNTTGGANTAIGEDALRRNTTGSNNTALGENAMNFNITGSNNTALGRGTSITNFSNATAIGYNTAVTASNKIRLGNANITSLESQVNLSVTSDGRFKRNLREDVPGLDFILRLRPLTYTYDVQALHEFYGIPQRLQEEAKSGDKRQNAEKELAQLTEDARAASQIRHTGFIAQEVEEAAEDCGTEFSGVVRPQNEHDNYALRYAEFTVPLVKAVQEQQAMIERQARQIEELQKVLATLSATRNTASTNAPVETIALTLSPSPGNGVVNAQFTLMHQETVGVQILDMNGRQLANYTLGTLEAGNHERSFNLQQLPKGQYCLRLHTGAETMTKQFSIQ